MRQKLGYSARRRRLSFAGSLARLTYTDRCAHCHCNSHICLAVTRGRQPPVRGRTHHPDNINALASAGSKRIRDALDRRGQSGPLGLEGALVSFPGRFLTLAVMLPKITVGNAAAPLRRRYPSCSAAPGCSGAGDRSLYRGHKLRSAENYASGIAADPDDGRR